MNMKMKSKIEILEEKLRKSFPKSMKTIDDAIQFMIDNGIGYTRGAFFISELPEDYNEQGGILSELREVVSKSLFAVASTYPDTFIDFDGKAYKCWGVYMFSNKTEFEEYSKHRDWSGWTPHVKKYKHLHIYEPFKKANP